MNSNWNYQEYLSEQVEEIKKLQSQGYTSREIIDRNKFSLESLKMCGLPVSYLIPKTEGAQLDYKEWDTHTSSEHKWELYNGIPFGSEEERDRVLMGLIYSCGLKHLVEILPKESKAELIKVVSSIGKAEKEKNLE